MKPALDELGISHLSNEARLELIGDIWDSITDSADQPPMPDWHARVLQERLASADKRPDIHIRWEDLKVELDPS